MDVTCVSIYIAYAAAWVLDLKILCKDLRWLQHVHIHVLSCLWCLRLGSCSVACRVCIGSSEKVITTAQSLVTTCLSPCSQLDCLPLLVFSKGLVSEVGTFLVGFVLFSDCSGSSAVSAVLLRFV